MSTLELPPGFADLVAPLTARDPVLLSQYNVAKYFPDVDHEYLAPLMLSPRGVVDRDGAPCLRVCEHCMSSLDDDKMPEWAIAAGHHPGSLPYNLDAVRWENVTPGSVENFEGSTDMELDIVTPALGFGRVLTMQGGAFQKDKSKKLVGHKLLRPRIASSVDF